MAGSPQALFTLFELPLDQFQGASSEATAELTAEALQALELDTAATTDAEPTASAGEAAEPPAAARGPTCIACGVGVGGAPGFASAEEQRRHFSLDW